MKDDKVRTEVLETRSVRVEQTPALTAPLRMTAEQFCEAKSTPIRKFLDAQAFCQWPIGKELTEDEYDNAILAAAAVTIR